MSEQPNHLDRRGFLKSSLFASSLAVGASFEENALLAQQAQTADRQPAPTPKDFPQAKIGHLSISRLICGGNLISGFAHSRDLIYVSKLLQQYFTDDKVCDTLALCEANGINTAILRLDANTLRILNKYWKERGGKIQWIAQVSITERDLETELKMAIDNGAVGAYTHGGVGDAFVKLKKVDVLGKAVDFIKKNKAIAGIAGHQLAVPIACEAAGIKPDFYMKTFNSKDYWSAQHPQENDNVWDQDPAQTIEFMAKVTCPWIAYKVLGAGAIRPEEGFRYAYKNGADLLCVGMFDFQIADDAQIAQKALEVAKNRPRPWRA